MAGFMKMSCDGVGTLSVKVEKFASPMASGITSAQTKKALHHFPVKASHESASFSVVCSNWPEMKTLQEFIRATQVAAINLGSSGSPEVKLSWPERNIVNWSGLIKKFIGGDRRFNIVPRAEIEILLINSLVSRKTHFSSSAVDFSSVYAGEIPRKPYGAENDPNKAPGKTLEPKRGYENPFEIPIQW